MNKKQEIIRKHLVCTCDEAYKRRNMTDPNCFLCEHESEIELIIEEYHPDVNKFLLADFEKWVNKKGNESYCSLPTQYVIDKYKSLNCG